MKQLDYLKGALCDAVSDDCTSDDIIRAVRSGLGDQVAYHKQMADKAQKALDQLNKFGPIDTPLYPNYSASDTVAFDDPYVWGNMGHPFPSGNSPDHIELNTSPLS